MTAFACVADESADENPRDGFFYGGFSAPIDVWQGLFAEAWQERVLDGPPRIPYLHMTDVRDRLSWDQAERRLDEAARVIRSTGALIPVMIWVDQKDYDQLVRRDFAPRPGVRPAVLEPDYVCFACFAAAQMDFLHASCPDLERVDFWVESNPKVTRNLADFHASLQGMFAYIGRPELAPLVGGYREVPKTEIAAQAADVLAWHARRARKGTLNRAGQRRYWQMTTNGRGNGGRYGYHGGLDQEFLRGLGERFSAYPGE